MTLVTAEQRDSGLTIMGNRLILPWNITLRLKFLPCVGICRVYCNNSNSFCHCSYASRPGPHLSTYVPDLGVQHGMGWFTTGVMLLSTIAVVSSASELSFAPSAP